MGLLKLIKQKAAQREGEILVKENPGMKQFLYKYKAPIGSAFLVVWGWSVYNNCPHILSFDVLSLVHVSCSAVQQGLGYVGFFLVGAGVIKTDQYHKDKAEQAKFDAEIGSK